MVLSVIEIALLIVLPLILFYRESGKPPRFYIPVILLLYITWYLTYAFLHETSHLLGVWITGTKVEDYQLIPHFWKGEFGKGFIRSVYDSKSDEFVVVFFAYLRDLLFLTAGYFILKRMNTNRTMITGLVMVLFILSPTYDIIDNYLAFLLGAKNDFNALKVTSNMFTSHMLGITMFLYAGMISFVVFRKTLATS